MLVRWPTTRYLQLCLALALTGAACAGTEVGNPEPPPVVEATVEFALYVPEVPGALRLGSGVELDEVWFFLDEVELRSSATCDEERDEEVERPGPVVVDLVSGKELPGPIELVHDPGMFCRLELELREGEPAVLPIGAPIELGESSVFVRGRTADGTPFELRSSLSQEWRLDASEGFSLAMGRHRLVVAFAVEEWFAAVDLATAVGEGAILIDDENNRELLESFEGALVHSAKLMRDANRDGVIDRDEAETPLAVGALP